MIYQANLLSFYKCRNNIWSYVELGGKSKKNFQFNCHNDCMQNQVNIITILWFAIS